MNRFFRRSRRCWVGMAGLALAAAAPAHAADAPAPPVLTVGIGGDLLGPYQSLADIEDSGFGEVQDIMRSADAVVANQEGSIFDAERFEIHPSAENNGLPLSREIVAHELRAMGVTLLSKANNHAADWGLEGLRATEEALDRAGIAYAGSGESEAAARGAAFAATPNGEVGLVSLSSTFQPMARAADAGESQRGPLRARPGISVLRLTASMRLSGQDFAAVAAIAGRDGEGAGAVSLGSQSFVAGERPGFDYAMDARDETAILAAVDAAAARAPTIVAIHAHETDNGDSEDPVPPDFLVRLARDSIDRGAAAFVRHGPHGVNGIEIYRGRPIFYGIGSLFFDFGGRRSYTVPETGQVIDFPDTWFEGILATVSMRDGAPLAVTLYPLLLDDTPTPSSGMPRLARGEDAQRILARIQQFSREFGTEIAIRGDIGTIAIQPE